MYKLPVLWEKHSFFFIALFVVVHIHSYILFLLRTFRCFVKCNVKIFVFNKSEVSVNK